MYLILDALADGAVKMGITRQLAIRLAAQTMLGSASMVVSELNKESNGKHIMQMKEEVCSPGGTTCYGIHELERNGLRNSLISAIEAATNRGKQLSK
jgi:pyrroline-5-carboxylate reductase